MSQKHQKALWWVYLGYQVAGVRTIYMYTHRWQNARLEENGWHYVGICRACWAKGDRPTSTQVGPMSNMTSRQSHLSTSDQQNANVDPTNAWLLSGMCLVDHLACSLCCKSAMLEMTRPSTVIEDDCIPHDILFHMKYGHRYPPKEEVQMPASTKEKLATSCNSTNWEETNLGHLWCFVPCLDKIILMVPKKMHL